MAGPRPSTPAVACGQGRNVLKRQLNLDLFHPIPAMIRVQDRAGMTLPLPVRLAWCATQRGE